MADNSLHFYLSHPIEKEKKIKRINLILNWNKVIDCLCFSDVKLKKAIFVNIQPSVAVLF